MTFDEFQALCNQALSTQQAVNSPCPITVGAEGAPVLSTLGDTPSHQLILFTMQPDNAVLQSIYRAVMFTFDAPNNQTVIQPFTTGA